MRAWNQNVTDSKKIILDMTIQGQILNIRPKKCPTILYGVSLWLKLVSATVTGAKSHTASLQDYPLGTRRCCDIVTTSMTLLQCHNNVVCPVGSYSLSDGEGWSKIKVSFSVSSKSILKRFS